MSDTVQPHRRQPNRLLCPWDSPGKNTGVGCHFLLQCLKVKSESEVAQSCLTLSIPMDCSLPGSSIHGIFQARVLEWGAIAFSISYTKYMETCGKADLFFCFKALNNWKLLTSNFSNNDQMILFFLAFCCWSRRRQWHPTPVLLPGKSHGWRSLVGCSPWGR